MSSPTSRSLAECKKRGLYAESVERFNRFSNTRRDYAGVIDIIGIDETVTIGIQACAGASHSARKAKALSEPRLLKWLNGPSRTFWIWSWSKKGKAGKRKLWMLREEQISIDSIAREAAERSAA
jgi:DUF1365 family protein